MPSPAMAPVGTAALRPACSASAVSASASSAAAWAAAIRRIADSPVMPASRAARSACSSAARSAAATGFGTLNCTGLRFVFGAAEWRLSEIWRAVFNG